MTDGIEVSSDSGPIVDLIALPHSKAARSYQVARLRRQQEKSRIATEQYAKQLDQLYEDIARSGRNADWLADAAELVRRKEAAERERLRPGIEALKQKLVKRQDDHEDRRLIEESIAIGEAWLSFPAALYKKLLQLAAERRVAAEEIRGAHPVEGEIDYGRLSREHLARYPKIRAALAK